MSGIFIKKYGHILLITGLIIYLSGCYYDKEAELYPFTNNCDTTNVTFSGSVAPVMASNCNGCHSGASASAGVKTDNYNDLLVIVNNGKLWGTVNHDPGFKPMPQNAQILPVCDRSKIKIWITAGAPNN